MAESDQVAHALRLVAAMRSAAPGLVRAVDLRVLDPRQLETPPAEVETRRAFVSWAHRHASWNSKQEQEWQTQVAKFTMTLRGNGIAADVDLFHLEDSSIDWTRFGPSQVAEADTVLIVVSEAWAERWEGRNHPREGAGAVAEADELQGLFTRDQEAFQRKCLMIVFPDVEEHAVPARLSRLNRFSVDPYDLETYENLLRTLTGQPRFVMPALGDVPTFPVVMDGSDVHQLSVVQLRKKAKSLKRAQAELVKAGGDEAAQEDLAMQEASLRGVIDALSE
ncbi:MAG: hypothetical protein JWP95_1516 [Actinotalea sp.]|nr:hypothetical protein [Actinotalea sp.]